VPDPAQFVPKASFDELQTQFAALSKDIQGGKVEAALEKARDEGKLTPDLETWATQLAAKDLAEFEAWAKVAPVRVEIGRRQLAGKVPPKVTGDTLDPLERQVAARMGVSAEDFVKNRNALSEG
jgi:phage I-like protein